MSEEQRGRSAPPGVGPAFSPAVAVAASQAADLDARNRNSNSPSPSFIDDNDMPPSKPGLWLLKTKAEARASTATVQAWTIELPSRAANTVLGYALSCLCAMPPFADSFTQSHQGQRS
jgi:tRNA-specific adenosine deaminase 3